VSPLFPTGFLNECRSSASCSPPTRRTSRHLDGQRCLGSAGTVRHSVGRPIAALRIGQIEGQVRGQPDDRADVPVESRLIYVGNEKDMLMIEGSADSCRARFIEALEFAHQPSSPSSRPSRTRRRRRQAKRSSRSSPRVPKSRAIIERVAGPKMSTPSSARKNRSARLTSTPSRPRRRPPPRRTGRGQVRDHDIISFRGSPVQGLPHSVLEKGVRADQRDATSIRPISCEVGVLPRVHGSGLFQRGDTQVWSSRRSGPPRRRRNSMRSPAAPSQRASSFTTTSRRSPSVKPAAPPDPAAAKSATVRWRNARCSP